MNLRDSIRAQGQQFRKNWKSSRGSTLLALARPEFGEQPQRWQRLVEPVLAVVFIGVLAALAGAAGVSLLGFMLASALMYLVLTKVFGIRIETPIVAH